ncbi:MAG: hypothetical protein B6U76_09100 [Desulfurococcales archaeon ex4484_217_2]|nr:MAG: hypothetical protein B6U76_09100 [Desulfurococcales archaeon ex4484_217_2]
MYIMKYSKIPPLIMDIWRQNNIYYTLLTYLENRKRPYNFFKTYPPVIFALTILAFVAYADIKLKQKPKDLIILSTINDTNTNPIKANMELTQTK